MPAVAPLPQQVERAGLQALRRVLRDAELGGDLVRRLEADAVDVGGQPVGVLLHQLRGVGAVGLVDLDRVVGGDPVRLEEDHHLLDLPLLLPGAHDLLASFGADPLHLGQPLRPVLDDVERLQAERRHHPGGHHLADPADQAGPQVLLDADERAGGDRGVGGDPELPAVLRVVDPRPAEAEVLARLHAQQVADGGHQVAVSRHLEPHHAPGVLLVREDDPLQHPLQGGGVAGLSGVEGEGHGPEDQSMTGDIHSSGAICAKMTRAWPTNPWFW